AVQRLVEIARPLVEILGREPPLDARAVHFDDERRRAVHRRGERLRAAHAAETGGDDGAAAQCAVKMALRSGGESLVRPLQNALRSDVNPAAGRHLAEHREAAMLEIAEVVPGGPGRDE